MAQHLQAGPDYHEVEHPVQIAVRAAFEEMTGETSPGYGIDGCSAPNWACSIAGLGAGYGALRRWWRRSDWAGGGRAA